VGDREAREQEARDIRAEAAEAGLPAAWFMMHDVPTSSAPICPECEQGKHPNCNGEAWDSVTDSITDCKCPRCMRGEGQ
jgi:hypothetical protein